MERASLSTILQVNFCSIWIKLNPLLVSLSLETKTNYLTKLSSRFTMYLATLKSKKQFNLYSQYYKDLMGFLEIQKMAIPTQTFSH